MAAALTPPKSLMGNSILGMVGAALTKNPYTLILAPLTSFKDNIDGFLFAPLVEQGALNACMGQPTVPVF
jgi:hypothetical protein